MQHTKDLRVIVMLALVVTLAMVTGTPAQQGAVDETLGRPAPVGGPASGGPVPPGGTEALLDDFNRADGPIGSNWTVWDGYCNVLSNAAESSGHRGLGVKARVVEARCRTAPVLGHQRLPGCDSLAHKRARTVGGRSHQQRR